MTKNKAALPDLRQGFLRRVPLFFKSLRLWPGFLGLGLILTALSFLCTYEFSGTPQVYELGEIAGADIASPFTFYFSDDNAIKFRRDAVRKAQPIICIQDLEPIERLDSKLEDLFTRVREAGNDPERIESLRQTVSEELGEEISVRMFSILRDEAIQTLIHDDLLPWIKYRLQEGVLQDNRILANYSSGVIIRNAQEQTIASHTEISDLAGLHKDLEQHLQKIHANRLTNSLVLTLLSNYIAPTLTPDLAATAQNAEDAAKAVRPVMLQVMAGEVIVRQGEKISPEHMPKLRALWNTTPVKFNVTRFLGILLGAVILCSGLFFSPSGKKMDRVESKDLLFTGFIVTFFAVAAKTFALLGGAMAAYSSAYVSGAHMFAVPVAGATLMITAFSSRRYFITCMLLAMFCTLVNNDQLPLFMFYFFAALFGSWITNKAQSRKGVVKTLPALIAMLIPLWLATTITMGGDPARLYPEFIALMLGSFLSLLLTFALPPLIEILFGFTTRFSLMELMNQEHPVLRQLMFDAPGTYHHCLIVANMAELAAQAINSNPLLCKVGALYHDIGKADKPQYFIENQFRGENPHTKISPTMSALVLISHVKYGVELATQAHLGKEIIDIIREHHGTRVIQYFYQKALATNSQVQEEDFRYEGPRPSTVESAIIMLADVVEASSRTLENPTPSRIRTHVQRMIRSLLAEGQLNNVELTFKDLEQVEDSFTLILTGMFHKRIEYPGKQTPAPSATNPAATANTPANVGNAPLNLPAQPMVFDPDAESRMQQQLEHDQSRLSAEDYHAAKWLNLGDSFDETMLLNKKLKSAAAQNIPDIPDTPHSPDDRLKEQGSAARDKTK
ncbi:MAG: HDIG domain-containing protein [Deltaproteobacteria bacterium]|jgi:putative nucleotidyltransferase with HDIG domain|nr:HDIG domain-containing protein [Deltaproteobacteria bacterium]